MTVKGERCPKCLSDKCECSIKKDRDCRVGEKKYCLLCYDCGYSEAWIETRHTPSQRLLKTG